MIMQNDTSISHNKMEILTKSSNVSDTSIAIIIPAFRAAATIEKVLTGLPSFVNHIIVVDDCSPDETSEIVNCQKLIDPRIHLVRHSKNQGVGGAVLTGYSVALELGADICVKMDSDDQMDPAFLPDLLEPIVSGGADYTKGNRFMFLRDIHRMPLLRRIGNIGLSFLSKVASGYWNIFDPSNGYTAIHRSVLGFILKNSIDKRFFFETSMLIELGIIRAVIKDVFIPARYNDEHSNLSEVDTLFRFPMKLIFGAMRRFGIQYFIRDFTGATLFLLIGIPSLIFGTIFGAYHWGMSIITNQVATTGTVMVAVLPFILGVQFILQAFVLDIHNVPTEPIQSLKTFHFE